MLLQQTSTVEYRSFVVYAQDKNTLPVWIILSPAYHHISINSHPFLVGIVSYTSGDPEEILSSEGSEDAETSPPSLWLGVEAFLGL